MVKKNIKKKFFFKSEIKNRVRLKMFTAVPSRKIYQNCNNSSNNNNNNNNRKSCL